MRAIIVEKPGEAENLKIGTWDKPPLEEKEILVKVAATALNRADILQRMGKYPPPKGASPILGLEIAGTVDSCGPGCTTWKKGDRVFGLIPGGGYAEYAVIHEDMAMEIPNKLSFTEAAAIPEVFLTAFQAIKWIARLTEEEIILIHAGASGVGTAAIQIAREIGSKIIVTASEKKLKTCLDLGADLAIDYTKGPFIESVLEATNNKGVDVIIDFIAASYFNQNIDCLNTDGRMVLLATLSGGLVDGCDLRKILAKRLSITGSTLRSRSRDYQIKLTRQFSEFALPLFQKGLLTPVVDSIFNWNKVVDAHKYMEANKNIGKIVLKID